MLKEKESNFKDLVLLNIKYIFHQKICTAIIALMIMLLSVVIPLFYMLAALLYNDTTGQLSNIYFSAKSTWTDNQTLYYIFVSVVSPFILSFLSIMFSFIASAACFVSERENKTMSLLSLSATEPIRIYDAKIIAVFIFSLCCTAIAAFVSGIISVIGCSFMDIHGTLTLEKIAEFILLNPGLVFLSTHLSYIINRKKNKVFSAISSCGYVCLPFVVLHIGEFTGLYSLNLISYLGVFAFLLAASFIIYIIARKKISYSEDI